MNSFREFLDTIKFEHTIFALPFAYMTLFLVERGWPSLTNFLWITVAMVAGRTFGMAANRLIDAEIDARNPRTSSRALPAGRLTKMATLGYMALTIALFLLAVYRLAPLCRRLWPIVLAAMVLYPYAKRFTRYAHLFLGLVYVLIPTSIWIAVTNGVTLVAVALGIGAGLWVAGFDIIYACQDVEVDRREGLHSLPADAGLAPSLWIARIFHAAFLASLVWVGLRLDLGVLYYAGVAVTGAVLAYEHRLVSPTDLSKVNAAFFTANGLVSVALFILTAADTIL